MTHHYYPEAGHHDLCSTQVDRALRCTCEILGYKRQPVPVQGTRYSAIGGPKRPTQPAALYLTATRTISGVEVEAICRPLPESDPDVDLLKCPTRVVDVAAYALSRVMDSDPEEAIPDIDDPRRTVLRYDLPVRYLDDVPYYTVRVEISYDPESNDLIDSVLIDIGDDEILTPEDRGYEVAHIVNMRGGIPRDVINPAWLPWGPTQIDPRGEW